MEVLYREMEGYMKEFITVLDKLNTKETDEYEKVTDLIRDANLSPRSGKALLDIVRAKTDDDARALKTLRENTEKMRRRLQAFVHKLH